jgi:hypothetical protein
MVIPMDCQFGGIRLASPVDHSHHGESDMNHLSTDIGTLELGHIAVGFDGALEATASVTTRPTGQFPHCISDGALESAAKMEMGPSINRIQGRCF